MMTMMKLMKVLWYTPAHVHQDEQSNKRVCFSESMKPPKPFLQLLKLSSSLV
jgi:hypothetical protein